MLKLKLVNSFMEKLIYSLFIFACDFNESIDDIAKHVDNFAFYSVSYILTQTVDVLVFHLFHLTYKRILTHMCDVHTMALLYVLQRLRKRVIYTSVEWY